MSAASTGAVCIAAGAVLLCSCGHSPHTDLKATRKLAVVELSGPCAVDLSQFRPKDGEPALDAVLQALYQNAWAGELLSAALDGFLTQGAAEMDTEVSVPADLMSAPAYQALVPQPELCAAAGTRALASPSDEALARLAHELGVDAVMRIRVVSLAVQDARVTLVPRLQGTSQATGWVVHQDGHRPLEGTVTAEGRQQDLSVEGLAVDVLRLPVESAVKELAGSALDEVLLRLASKYRRVAKGLFG